MNATEAMPLVRFNTHVREMIRADLADVAEIEALSDPEHAWNTKDFLEVLREPSNIGLTALRHEARSDSVVGYVIYHKCQDHIKVLNFTVSPADLRTGVGTQLMRNLKARLCRGRRELLTIVVRESNNRAINFLRGQGQGFKAVKVLRREYESEDGYKFDYKLEE